jgi:hypothetical protein
MLTLKKIALKPILESRDGIHLTAYLVNRGNPEDLKAQLRRAIEESIEWLDPVMSRADRDAFLAPLKSLLLDSRVFSAPTGNFGIFRNQKAFRVLSIPVRVRRMCQVASSFHVKPLLCWIQADPEFLLVGLTKDAAHLYLGSQTTMRLVDSITFPKAVAEAELPKGCLSLTRAMREKFQQRETSGWLNSWIGYFAPGVWPKVFVAGEKSLVESLNRKLGYYHLVKIPIAPTFSHPNVPKIWSTIRKIQRADSKELLQKTALELKLAQERSRARSELAQISIAAIQGKVRKLVVTDEVSIFGKIDKASGKLSIHPFDLDHEDDDILDDLAQLVLSLGGEVVIAPRAQIPNGRPALAIVSDDDDALPRGHLGKLMQKSRLAAVPAWRRLNTDKIFEKYFERTAK